MSVKCGLVCPADCKQLKGEGLPVSQEYQAQNSARTLAPPANTLVHLGKSVDDLISLVPNLQMCLVKTGECRGEKK